MFALGITFNDAVSPPEMIFVRRPHSLIGSTDYAHVVVEDMKELGLQLRLVRDLGRRFRTKPIGIQEDSQASQLLDSSYEGEALLDLGGIAFHVTALDSDLLLKDTEPPDRAGVRILRQACAAPWPLFPALVVRGNPPMVVSFVPDQPIFIGRSKHCALRLDSADISAKHARMGYESGEFWIEDLGSTNGTFINQQQISGRVNVPAGQPIVLGREVTLVGVTSEDQIIRATRSPSELAMRSSGLERKYPILVSVSEVARPARFVIPLGGSVTLGRDPSCDIWLGAPHVSRKHCVVALSKTDALTVTDLSTNGTAYDGGILKRGDTLEVGVAPKVLDFGGGVTVAICHDDQQERQFTTSHGSPWAFGGGSQAGFQGTGGSLGGLSLESFYSGTPLETVPGIAAKLYELYLIFLGLRFSLKALVVVVFFSLLVVLGIMLSLLLGVVT